VMDRCIMVEHAALLGRNWKVPKVSGGDTKGGS
jgi:hypothetical protein